MKHPGLMGIALGLVLLAWGSGFVERLAQNEKETQVRTDTP